MSGSHRCGPACEALRPHTRPVENLEDLLGAIEPLLTSEWVTRGVGSADYALHSTLDRAIQTRRWDGSARWLEHALLRKFQREAHLETDGPSPSDGPSGGVRAHLST